MPTIRDLVRAIAEREGVDGVVVLGRDGLLIEAQTSQQLDGEQLAALAPAIAIAAESLGEAAARGPLVTAVAEYERGIVVLSSLNTDALLLVAVREDADVAPLLFELRRHRASISSIV